MFQVSILVRYSERVTKKINTVNTIAAPNNQFMKIKFTNVLSERKIARMQAFEGCKHEKN